MATIKVKGKSSDEVARAFNDTIAAMGLNIRAKSSSNIENNYCKINFETKEDAQTVIYSTGGQIRFLDAEVNLSMIATVAGTGTAVKTGGGHMQQVVNSSAHFPVLPPNREVLPPQIRGDVLKVLEGKFLNQIDTDLVRLSTKLIPEVVEKADLIGVQCFVELEKYSDTVIMMKGTKNGLINARRLLCQLTSLAVQYTIQRIIVEKYRLLKVSETEQQLARQQWVGRRVLIRNSGELAIVRDILFEGDIIVAGVSLYNSEMESAEDGSLSSATDDVTTGVIDYAASEVICWDVPCLVDSISVLHAPCSKAYLQRLFGETLNLPVEQVENIWEGQGTSLSSIRFDITLDPTAPAKAVTSLHNVKVDSFKLQVLVSAPTVPVRLVPRQPSTLIFTGPRQLSREILEVLFSPGTIKKIDVKSKSPISHKTYVKFFSSEHAVEFRQGSLHEGLPNCLNGFSVVLDCFKLNILDCYDVPSSLSIDILMADLNIKPEMLSRRPWESRVTNIGYKTVTFTFQPGSEIPLTISRETPFVNVSHPKEDKQLNYYHTATALVAYIQQEESYKLSRAAFDDDTASALSDSVSSAADYSEEGSVSSGQSPGTSIGSDVVENIEPRLAVSLFNEIAGKCSSDVRLTKPECDAVIESIRRIVAGVWPRVHKNKNPCLDYKAFELGFSNRPCKNGFLCKYEHVLKPCLAGGVVGRVHGGGGFKCKGQNKCSRIHQAEINNLLRLDVDLCRVCESSGSVEELKFDRVQDCLQSHRSKMLVEATKLLSDRDEFKQIKVIELECKKQEQTSSIEESVRKTASMDAMSSRIVEIEHQIREFTRAKESFDVSDNLSFRAARVFAREVYNRFKTCLPIYAERQAIVNAVKEDFSVLVLSAETGSGKSTQVVQYISELVPGKVLCTQPRKVAAVTLADRVAEEMRTLPPSKSHPNLVACRQPGGVDTSQSSILFMTDASLLNQLYSNIELPHVSAVIVDEVHERSVNTDLLIALLRRTLQLRSRNKKHPFKLVLTSATMNDALFAAYFARKQWDESSPMDDSRAPVLKVGGRTFPVEIHFEVADSQSNYERAAEIKVLELHKITPATNMIEKQNFDFLVFLTQADEVDRLAAKLQQQLPDCKCLPLHGSLEPDEQKKAFEKVSAPFVRKIVVSTNIAETSVTIDGIGVVIDTGLSKQARYDPSKDATVLAVGFIAQSSAKQRAGRAGRTAAGDCYRLYSKSQFDDMDADTPAELLRSDAAEAILSILRQLQKQRDWIADIRKFPFVEHPGEPKLEKALKLLFYLRAIDSMERTELTAIGNKMARMSTSPRVSAILFAGQRCGVPAILSIALGMSQNVGNLFRRGKTDEEKETSSRSRTRFAERFPDLGDIGMAIAVWLEAKTKDKHELKGWCNENYINFRVLSDAQKTIRSMLQEMLAGDSDASSASSKNVQAKSSNKAFDNEAVVDISANLSAITAASFTNAETLPKMLESFMAGYFGNLAFHVPPRAGDDKAPPAYFLPGANQLGFLSSAAAFRMSKRFPDLCIYMEIVENRKLYISSLIGVDLAKFRALLPPAFSESAEFATFMRVNDRRQMLARPAVISTTCPSALKQLYGKKDGVKVKQLIQDFKKEFNLPLDCDLLIEADFQLSQLLVMSNIEDKKNEIARRLQMQLEDIQRRLETRIREWAIPGTNIRAVIGAGGKCEELLLRPTCSIGIRFTAEKLSQRLSEPITVLKGIPQGFFSTIAESRAEVPSDEIVQRLFFGLNGRPSDHMAAATQKRAKIPDLQATTLGQVLSAIEYTSGKVCYLVNPFLRACNEAECRLYEAYIKALNSFHNTRAAHKSNKRGDMLVYRGCPIPNDQVATYSPGANVVWPSFTSTSMDRNVALTFAWGSNGQVGNGQVATIFEINTPFYCPLQDISVYPGEQEILLPAFSVFTVESNEITGDGIRNVRMKHLKDPPRETISSHDQSGAESAMEEAVRTGRGPVIIKVPVESSKPSGLAQVLERELLRIDPTAEIDISYDETSGRVWGKGFFSKTDLASKACAILHTSILGDRELAVFSAPVDTDTLPFTSRVSVTMTSVPHKGNGSIDCRSEANAQRILQYALATAPRTKTGIPKSLNPLTFPGRFQVKVGEFKKGKGGDKVPTMVHIADIPPDVSVEALEAAFAGLNLNLPRGSVQVQKDKEAVEKESKCLKQSGVNGTRKRIAFLTSAVGNDDDLGLDQISETSLERGAQYTLWFHSSNQALKALQKLNGKVMPVTNLIVSAVLDNSCTVVLPSEVYHLLKHDVKVIQDTSAGVDIIVQEKTGKNGAFYIKMDSADMALMAIAYRKLKALQNGSIINVAVQDRGKLFPSRADEAKCTKVANLLKTLSKGCIVRPFFTQSIIRVIGPPAIQLRVAEKLSKFLAEEKFEVRMRIPGKAMRHIKELKQQSREGVEIEIIEAKCQLILKSLDSNKISNVRSEVSSILESIVPDRLSLCSVCYEVSSNRLGTCGHNLCEDCGLQYCQTSVCENRIPVRDPSCNRILLLEDVYKLSNSVSAINMAGVRSFMRNNLDDFCFCHTPDCPQILDKRTTVAHCPVCMTDQCPQCGELPHEGEACEAAQSRRVFEQSPEGRVLTHVKVLTEKFLAPSCPACSVSFVDFSGCFAISCGNCPTSFCGFCLANCGRDAHPHVANCPFASKHFSASGYFHQADMFVRSMCVRLPELARDYMMKNINDHYIQQLVFNQCKKDMDESPFFSKAKFLEMMPHLK